MSKAKTKKNMRTELVFFFSSLKLSIRLISLYSRKISYIISITLKALKYNCKNIIEGKTQSFGGGRLDKIAY